MLKVLENAGKTTHFRSEDGSEFSLRSLLGRSWSDLARLGANLGSPEAVLEPLEAILARFWAPKEGREWEGDHWGRRLDGADLAPLSLRQKDNEDQVPRNCS